MSEAFVYEAVRTPFGRFGGALAGVRPDDLAAHALRALLERAGDPDPAAIDDVILGAANGAGEDNRNVARMAVLLAGLPTTVTGATVNRLCGSSLEAAIQADARDPLRRRVAGRRRRRRVDDAARRGCCCKPSRAYPGRQRDAALDDARLAHGQPADARAVDDLARRERREARRHLRDLARGPGRVRAAQPPARRAGLRRGRAAARSCPSRASSSTRDEGIRTDTTLEKLAELAPAFVEGGTVTAGNSSPLNDGASMTAARRRARRPAARPRAARARRRERARTASTPTSSASPRSRRRTRRSRAPASAGARSSPSSSTRRSPRSRSPASRAGRSSTPSASTCAAARSRSDIRSAPRGRGSSGASPTNCTRAAAATASRLLCIGVGQGLAVILEA